MVSIKEEERQQLLGEVANLRKDKMQKEQIQEELKAQIQGEIDKAQEEGRRLQAQMANANPRTQEVHEQKKELEGIVISKNGIIQDQERKLRLWNDTFNDLKQGLIIGMAKQGLLESENKVLMKQYGEDKDVLILPPNAQALLLEILTQQLGATWNKALEAMNEMQEAVIRERKEGRLALHTAKEFTKELNYWKQEATKYKDKACLAEKIVKEATPSMDYVNLVREITQENKSLTSSNVALQNVKGKLKKFKEERLKCISKLASNLKDKTNQLRARKQTKDYPTQEGTSSGHDPRDQTLFSQLSGTSMITQEWQNRLRPSLSRYETLKPLHN